MRIRINMIIDHKVKMFVVIIGLVLLANLVSLNEAAKQKNGATLSKFTNKGRSKLFKLLDWNSYMNFFRKSYSSPSQQLVRQKIFLASVMQVFLTGAKYRFYQLSYYTAINKWSDTTPSEARQLLQGDGDVEPEQSGFTDDRVARQLLLEVLSNQASASPEAVELELQEERSEAMRKKRMSGGGKLTIRRRLRRKREAHEGGSPPPETTANDADNNNVNGRELSVADLIAVGEFKMDPKWRIRWTVSSDNPDYKPVKSFPLDNSSVSETVKDISPKEIQEITSNAQLSPTPAAVIKTALNEPINWSSTDKKDTGVGRNTIVIRDWRKDGCVGPPRDQGYCASCYAISSMGYLEWALCTNEGNALTPLSVQYIVSCGPQYMEETDGEIKLEGCRHGMSRQTMDFVREYGVELEVNMPYLERETICPIEAHTPRKKKGYIRPNVKSPIRLSAVTGQLDLALKAGPVIVSMREPKNFLAYGGGMVERCDPIGGHAMLVVGNMIEDGVEYLLIKNSFGPYWGYDGFFKFKRDKAALKECVKEFIVPVIGFPGRKAKQRRIKAYLASQQSFLDDARDKDIQDDNLIGAGKLLMQDP